MDLEEIRAFCLSLPGAVEDVKWGNDLVFSVGKKMFAVAGLDAAQQTVSFKCTPDKAAELVERDGIIPAHYVARYHWVTIENLDAVKTGELKALIQKSYELVRDKLPKKLRNELGD